MTDAPRTERVTRPGAAKTMVLGGLVFVVTAVLATFDLPAEDVLARILGVAGLAFLTFALLLLGLWPATAARRALRPDTTP